METKATNPTILLSIKNHNVQLDVFGKKDGRDTVYIIFHHLCTHPRLEVRDAELYDYWCSNAQRCVIVDTNGYAPLFFPVEKALKNKEFWQQEVQIERLAARIFCVQIKNTIFNFLILDTLYFQKYKSIGKI